MEQPEKSENDKAIDQIIDTLKQAGMPDYHINLVDKVMRPFTAAVASARNAGSPAFDDMMTSTVKVFAAMAVELAMNGGAKVDEVALICQLFIEMLAESMSDAVNFNYKLGRYSGASN